MNSSSSDVYCRHCGVRLRGLLGHWWHVKQIGPLACPGAEPEDENDDKP
jgi:hypothetical protein